MTTMYYADIPGRRVIGLVGYVKGNTFFITNRSADDCEALRYPTISVGLVFDTEEEARAMLVSHFQARYRDVESRIKALEKERAGLLDVLEKLAT